MLELLLLALPHKVLPKMMPDTFMSSAGQCRHRSAIPAGPYLDGESLYNLLESQRCTMSAGVPTVFLALLTYLQDTRKKLSSLKLITIGGAACPPLLLEVRTPQRWLH